MILDNLENSVRYNDLHQGFKKAFDFLKREDLATLPSGKMEIDGDKVFAIIDRTNGRPKEGANLEIHQQYIDIQYIISGDDTMGWQTKALCNTPLDIYDAEKDIQFFSNKVASWVKVTPTNFAIFFPEDGHLPLIGEGAIHKVVVKILV